MTPFTKAGSLELEEAAELMRLSHRRLVEAKAGVQAWRVASAVWGLTVPYCKGWEAVFVERLEALTGMDNRAVRRGIKACAQAGALEWEPNRWIPSKGEPGRPSLIGLPGAPKIGRASRPGQSDPVLGATKLLQTPSGSSTPGRGRPDSITPRSNGNALAKTVATQTGEARTGTPMSGTPEAGRGLEELTRDELDRAAYRALVDGDEAGLELIRNEAHRRDTIHSAVAMFGEPMEPRRRPE